MTPAKQRVLVLTIIAIGMLLVSLFGLRSIHAFREFRGDGPPPGFAGDLPDAETDVELVRDWMTIPFIAKMYRVPHPVLYRELGIPFQGNRDKSLKQLNDEYFPEVPGFVEASIKAVLLANMELPAPPAPAVPTP